MNETRPSSPTQITSVNVPPTSAPTRAPSRSPARVPVRTAAADRRACPACGRSLQFRDGPGTGHVRTGHGPLRRKRAGDQVDRPAHAVVDHPLGAVGVVRLARLDEVVVRADRPLEALGAREHEAVVAPAAPEQPLDLADEARAAGREVRGRVELPAAVEIRVDVLRSGRGGRGRASRSRIRSSSRRPDGRGAEPRGEPFEPEPRGVELLEVLAREPADERAAVVGHLDEARPARARRARGGSASARCRAARRGRAARAASPPAAGRRRSARAAPCVARCSVDERPIGSMSARCSLRTSFTLALRRCMLGARDLRFHVARPYRMATTANDSTPHRRRRRRHLHRRDPPAARRPRDDPQAALDAAELRRGGRRGGRRARRPSRREVADVVHGTTVATNAVLERRGALTALVTTAGFRDVLELRRLRIPHMYDPFWRKPEPLVPRRRRYEVNERVTADGTGAAPARPRRGARRRGAARGRRRRVGRGLPAALVPLPGPRGAARRDPARGAARRRRLALERDPARAARVRALGDDGRQRVRPAADARLRRRHPQRARRRRDRGKILSTGS